MSDVTEAELTRLLGVPVPEGTPSPWPEEDVADGVWIDLAGVRYVAGYPQVIHLLATELALDHTVRTRLVREPANPFDVNAVLLLWMVGHPDIEAPRVLGHLPASWAARVSPELAQGVAWSAASLRVGMDPMYPDQPGVSIELVRLAHQE